MLGAGLWQECHRKEHYGSHLPVDMQWSQVVLRQYSMIPIWNIAL